MAKDTDDLVTDAIASTENEIFNEAANGKGNESDRSLEDMEEIPSGQTPAEESDEDADTEDENSEETETQAASETTTEDKAKPNGQVEPHETRKRVPVGELISERKARQEAQAEVKVLRETHQREIAALNSRLDQILAQRDPATKQEGGTAQDETADIFSDPDGFISRLTTGIEAKFEQRFVDASLATAHDQHGKSFEEAYSAITSLDKNNPSDRATVQRIWRSPNPGAALMSWHKQQKTLQTVGSDPEKWLQDQLAAKLDDPEFLATAVEKARARANGQNGQPQNTTVRLPKSLNGMGGSQSRNSDPDLYNDTESSVFDFATR